MILFLEPISKNTEMYVPAYPLPVMEIASYVKFNLPDIEIKVISIPMDYGLLLGKKGVLTLGFESASYHTLRRINKVKDRSHYEKYISNTMAIFKEAVNNKIPIVVFMIAGYPSDKEQDLKESLAFARKLSKNKGPGGYIFKIGEYRVYPKTKIYDLALSLPDVVFDDNGVFGQNIVRQLSNYLDFDTVLSYMRGIYNLSNPTSKLQSFLLNIMPFFRLPANALKDDLIPETFFKGKGREIFSIQSESFKAFRPLAPKLKDRYANLMSEQRSMRDLVN